MKLALTMPQFGESIKEALIVRWLKKEGEEVKEQEPLVELETEKSVFAYESPFRGRVEKILGKQSAQVTVGTEIAHFEVSDTDGKRYLSMGIGSAIDNGARVAPSTGKAGSSLPLNAPSGLVSNQNNLTGKGISPLIRSLAKEKGIPLEEVERVQGTGPGGVINKDDFLKFLETRGGSSAASQPSSTSKIPLSPVRSRIAEKMSLSKREIPHAGTGVDVDVTAIEEWRQKEKSPYNFMPFVMSAVISGLRKFPVLNSSFRSEGGRQWREQHEQVHLGIATATEQGLLVPVLKDAEKLGFSQLAEGTQRLIDKGRAGKLEVSELTGGTFTINNTGALGAIRSIQIIPHPQAGILAVNRVTKRPWVVNGEIKIRSIVALDLAFDHRIVDGDAAVGFLEEVRKLLENFELSKTRS